ncbi:hypothetical protein QR680_001562 [Steinernema hermaphroditum]|uniref:ZP domain-containing protein n=1 Tax=Steinernema hermaphroditum TaxID=289476 RepID=A0AA39LG73_9BILA|nr:hypothetical protein QR680_001562 [Steinernema hermaphroditum]
MLVQNCYVEDMQGNKILIIDQNGCGVDQYVLSTPQYTRDLKTAFQESHVFKFAEKTVTRFTCQLRLCMNHDNGCEGITPPKCGSVADEDAVVHSKPLALEPPPISSTENDNDMLSYGPLDKKPPSISPKSVHGVPTAFGKNQMNRDKRQLVLVANGTHEMPPREAAVQRASSDNLPELDVVGILRVLDSPEDVEYFEERLKGGTAEEASALTCLPNGMYIGLIVTVIILVAIQIIAFTLVFVDRKCFAKLRAKTLKQSC